MPHLAVRDLVKEYPGVRALGGVSLEFLPGEVHGVIGENGAGKSTLMKILAGVEQPTSGAVELDGSAKLLSGVQDAMSSGIAMIHQELNLIDDLTVAENLFLGRETGWRINRGVMLLEAKRWLREVGAEFEPDVRVGRLSLAEKQLVEISKAVSTQAQILIMDEPTAVLSNREKAALFELIARLKKDGRSVILISHILSELVRHCDRISVLRDGEYVATVEAGSVTESELARMMVGRELGDLYPAIEPPGENVVVTLQTPDSRIELRAGEILGFGGLIGSGRTELWESLLGLRALAVGWAMTFSVRSRAAYVSEDRKGAGLHLEFSAEDNIALPWLGSFGPIKTDRRAVRCVAEKWREELSIKVADVGDRLGTLSGGNQQKVSLAKWLEGDPELLVLDEPTRGVDVGSKAQIYEIIAKLSRQGKALVVISSELPELLGLCHRVAVMKEGRIVAVLDRSELSEEAIMQHAAGVAI